MAIGVDGVTVVRSLKRRGIGSSSWARSCLARKKTGSKTGLSSEQASNSARNTASERYKGREVAVAVLSPRRSAFEESSRSRSPNCSSRLVALTSLDWWIRGIWSSKSGRLFKDLKSLRQEPCLKEKSFNLLF